MRQTVEKIFAYFGSDLELRNSEQFLRRTQKNGYTLLALDASATALATIAGVPYTIVDDWLEPETMFDALARADEAERGWFEPARDDFTVQGICWPELDLWSMRWFWQDAMLALALADAFRDHHCRELLFFGNFVPRPGIFYAQSDVNRLWLSIFPREARQLKRFGPLNPKGLIAGVHKAVARLKRSGRSAGHDESSGAHALDGKIVLLSPAAHVHRYRPVIKELMEHWAGKVAVAFCDHHPDWAEKLSVDLSVPVVCGPHWPPETIMVSMPGRLLNSPDKDLWRRFSLAFEKCKHGAEGKPWIMTLKTLQFHFDYYTKFWWPFLIKHILAFWEHLFTRTIPRAILVTALPQSSFLLPCIAARRAGIPVLALPEGAISQLLTDTEIVADHILYDCTLLKKYWEKSGQQRDLLVGARNIIAEDEYPVTAQKHLWSADRRHVLGLVSPTSEGCTLTKYTTLAAQLKALRALSCPPPDLADKLELKIKVHPYYHDMNMMVTAGAKITDKVIALDSSLRSVLLDADLVIAVNYFGTALLHTLRMGKPVIALNTEPDNMLQRPGYDFTLFQDGTTLAGSPEQLWSLVRSFLTDPDVAETMRRKSRTFARDNLSQAELPSIHEEIERILAPGTSCGTS